MSHSGEFPHKRKSLTIPPNGVVFSISSKRYRDFLKSVPDHPITIKGGRDYAQIRGSNNREEWGSPPSGTHPLEFTLPSDSHDSRREIGRHR